MMTFYKINAKKIETLSSHITQFRNAQLTVDIQMQNCGALVIPTVKESICTGFMERIIITYCNIFYSHILVFSPGSFLN